MASEWRIATIESLSRVVCSGGTPRTGVADYYDGGSIPWVTTTEVNYNRIVETNKCITEAGLAASSAKMVPPDTVIVAMYGKGTAGRVALAGVPLTTNQACCNVVVDETQADARFVYYALWSNFSKLDALANGSVQQNLNAGVIRAFESLVPPLPDQRAIAHILGTLDDKIELNRRMARTLEEMARALFKAWFVDFEPVRAKMDGRWRRGESLPGLPAHLYDLFPDRLVDSELGPIPEGWKLATLGAVAEQLRASVNPRLTPDVRFLHFSIPAFDDRQEPKWELGGSIKSQKFLVPPGAVLLSKLNPEIERVWLVDVQQDDRAVCSTEFLVLRPRPPYGRSYLYCAVSAPVFRRKLEALVTGTSKSHQRAQTSAILALECVEPPEVLVQEFERVAAPAFQRVAACRDESRSLSSLRDTLLPKLVSGELCVPDAERLLANVL